MRIDISCNNISSDVPLEVFIQEKIGSLDKIIGHDQSSAKVEVGKPSQHHRSGPIFRAEANLEISGKLFRAESTHEDLRAAIVQVKEELHAQIVKFKEKKEDSFRQPKK